MVMGCYLIRAQCTQGVRKINAANLMECLPSKGQSKGLEEMETKAKENDKG